MAYMDPESSEKYVFVLKYIDFNEYLTPSKKNMAKEKVKTSAKVIDSPLPNQHSEVIISWVSPSFVKHDKGIAWYVVAGLILIGILWYSLYSASWSTALVFLLFAGVYIMNSKHEPAGIVTAITELGVQHGTQFFPYSKIKGYWLVYKPPQVKVIHLQLTGRGGEITIDLGDQPAASVRNILSREIPEIEGKGEPFVNYVTRILKL
ncbi:MAG: hypothetical protein Q8P68_06435 [Candidatus Peregrinibacteria bacterium]|nr:hypothetical protein [Candidatus Peregrinibacteria bacterium]MDZ4244431.1 hypothetical protein [Candidatus Gracilibacteria bacterium]